MCDIVENLLSLLVTSHVMLIVFGELP